MAKNITVADGKYQMTLPKGKHIWRGIEFDTETISEKTCDQLMAMNYRHIFKVTKKKES